MLYWTIRSFLLFSCCALPVLAVDSLVDLGYSQIRGREVGEGTTQWLGVRYAAPPFGNICLPQNPQDFTMQPNKRFTVGEDCLFLNVFAPSAANTESNLPVLFFIQGGGFGSNSNANFNGSDLAREGDIVVVSINYRVGAFGFLQSQEVVDGGSLNNGMKDMVKALEWVKQNIRSFGGNPGQVIIDGSSSGASGVMILLAAPSMQEAGLFVGAISESTTEPTLRKLEQGQDQYNCLLQESGCSNTTDTLACLRSKESSKIQTGKCFYNPHLDNELIPITTFEAFEQGKYMKIPTIIGSCADEGTKSGTKQVDTLNDANAFFRNQLPSLSNASLSFLEKTYLSQPQPTFPDSGRLWRQTSIAHGDYRLNCVSSFYQDVQARDGVATYNYRYGVIDEEQESLGFGAFHTVELPAIWGPNNTDGAPPKSYLPNTNATIKNADIVPIIRGYITSFVRSLDPNIDRLNGTAEWRVWGTAKERLRFITNGTAMEKMPETQISNCAVLEPMMRALEQPPPPGAVIELNLPLGGTSK
ncbi:lipase 1 [Pyrenochaeta sp. MPI-SDFR-AT-0127]|nr:lipase 1 [Pyrenochaeta sp. MPI-SDFR-AT-0127]